MIVYFDKNVFDGLKNLYDNDDHLEAYLAIYKLIDEGNIIVPYSNAHINDLYRGYIKNSEHTAGDLSFINRITNSLCIAQYWGKESAVWHKRDLFEFFASAEVEKKVNVKPWANLLNTDGEFVLVDAIWEVQKGQMESILLPDDFKSVYQQSPIFSIIFPLSREKNNMMALCEDLYNFSYKIQEDNQLYKTFRKYLTQMQLQFPKYQKMIQSIKSPNIDVKPKHLTWEDFFDEITPKFKPGSNPNYDKIVGLFTTTDLKGYKKDERFSNMLDDALHTFYAAHGDYFVTNDKNCIAKAKLVYDKLGINTMVFNPTEFFDFYKSQKQT